MSAPEHIVIDELRLAQREAKGRLGHCLLLFQDCEAILKAILANHRLEVIDGADDREARQARLALATMGMTVNQLVEEVLLAYGASDSSDDWEAPEDSKGAMRSIIRLGCSSEEIERRKIYLRAFVERRNRLVHCFRQDHDLGTIDGCSKAIEHLEAVAAQVTEQAKDFAKLAEQIEQAKSAMLKQIQTAEFVQFIVSGEIAWRDTAIVQRLHEAARSLTVAGWVNIDEAVVWITARYPDEHPHHYSCKSWRHVLQASGLFDLRSAAAGNRTVWYRPKGPMDDGTLPAGRTLRLWGNNER